MIDLAMTEGVIYRALSGFYYVKTMHGTVECKARGRFRLDKNTPLVGDRVEFIGTEPGKGYLNSILARKNCFVRPPIANIDKMVVIASAAIPVTDPFLIDRMTAVAHKNGCETIICINKCDLNTADMLYEIYSGAGFKTIRTSAETGEGLQELQDAICGCVCALTGNSGVGKSSILNMIDPEFSIAVGDISKKLGRGRHTTRHVELYELSCGALIADTPGFSAFDTDKLTKKEELFTFFPDFEPYTGQCRFLDCANIKEPGCAVVEALEKGELQRSRHNSYIRLYELASGHKDWEHR